MTHLTLVGSLGDWKRVFLPCVLALAFPLAPQSASAQSFGLGLPVGQPGQQVIMVVVFDQEGAVAASGQLRISYDSTNTPIVMKADGTPDCTISPVIENDGQPLKDWAFRFWPNGCVGADCLQVRAFIYDLSLNPPQIPTDNDEALFWCTIQISQTAPLGSYPLIISDPRTFDSSGDDLVTTATDSEVTVQSSPPSSGGGASMLSLAVCLFLLLSWGLWERFRRRRAGAGSVSGG